jgi:DNA topoisomerase-2
MKIEDFLNTKLVNYASYDNLRKIASCVDGLKNAARKVLYTVHDKKIKDKIKVLQLANKCAEYSDYLHGDLSGVVVTLGQDFSGTNNLPLIEKSGSFGTRSVNESAAPRYIFANGSKDFFKIFKYEDDDILIKQEFEGFPIEPKFYLPVLPMILINGSEGVSSGFAQKILGRNPENVKKYLKDFLNSKKPKEELLDPFYKGFEGTFEKDTEVKNRWFVKGVIEELPRNEILIKEIPFQYDLQSYLKVLDDLLESKKIIRYSDESDGENKLQFKVTLPRGFTGDKYNLLKLIKPITENFTCINENNQIVIFDSAKEILEYYVKIKKEFLGKRKDFLKNKYNTELDILKSKLIFITAYIKKKIDLNNKPKDFIISQLENIKGLVKMNNFDYLLNMPIYSLTEEKIKNLEESIADLTNKIKTLEETTIEQLWLLDLKEI